MPQGYYINEYRANNQRLGTTVKGSKINDLYRLFVYADQGGEDSTPSKDSRTIYRNTKKAQKIMQHLIGIVQRIKNSKANSEQIDLIKKMM